MVEWLDKSIHLLKFKQLEESFLALKWQVALAINCGKLAYLRMLASISVSVEIHSASLVA